MKLIALLTGLTLLLPGDGYEALSNAKKTVMFQFADDSSNKVHDNNIVLYEYFKTCFIVLLGLSVGAVHRPQIYNLQMSVE